MWKIHYFRVDDCINLQTKLEHLCFYIFNYNVTNFVFHFVKIRYVITLIENKFVQTIFVVNTTKSCIFLLAFSSLVVTLRKNLNASQQDFKSFKFVDLLSSSLENILLKDICSFLIQKPICNILSSETSNPHIFIRREKSQIKHLLIH